MTTPEPEGREALIHLRVPAALKTAWVRQSRAASQTLTDWIIHRIEAGPVVRELQAVGEVSVGMCSAWQFVEL